MFSLPTLLQHSRPIVVQEGGWDDTSCTYTHWNPRSDVSSPYPDFVDNKTYAYAKYIDIGLYNKRHQYHDNPNIP